jgi:dTDP-4-amino-4,6-dideoxygalactose transaminase
MDLKQAEQKITPRTKVLILQHTFGIPVDLDAALALAQENNIIILEDCVHSLGATFDGRQVGSFGKAAFFSTEETKTISSTMGGMAVTDDPELAKKMIAFQSSCPNQSNSLTVYYLLRLIFYHIFSQPYLHPYTRRLYTSFRKGSQKTLTIDTATDDEQHGLRPPIYEQKLSNAQAEIALRQLQRLQSNIEHRRKVASAYHNELNKHGIIIPRSPAKANPVFVRFPVWVDDPKTFFRDTEYSFQLGEWFTSVLEESASPTYGGYDLGSCPHAEASTQHLVNLPTHPSVNPRDVDTIINTMVLLNSVHNPSK